jgi:CheY-like chemotaxis protein
MTNVSRPTGVEPTVNPTIPHAEKLSEVGRMRSDYTVHTATDGAAALELLARHPDIAPR